VLRGLLKLTWLEIKIFIREPLGLIGTFGMPILVFVGLGRAFGDSARTSPGAREFVRVDLPVFTAILIALSAVLSLVTIIAIYRDSGILKRLRATPLTPVTIFSAHVIVKLLLTAATIVLMILAGRRYYPVGSTVTMVSFAAALLFATFAILSLGFLIASLVPTARFAQPLGSLILYPMVATSGLFLPIASLPPSLRAVARVLPLTYAVSLLKGIWQGDSWSTHRTDVAALLVIFIACTALASRVFRWE
jgi:ABC-2 type transport system permease protein